ERTLPPRQCNGSFALPAKASGCTSESCLATPPRTAASANPSMGQNCFTTTPRLAPPWLLAALSQLSSRAKSTHLWNSHDCTPSEVSKRFLHFGREDRECSAT